MNHVGGDMKNRTNRLRRSAPQTPSMQLAGRKSDGLCSIRAVSRAFAVMLLAVFLAAVGRAQTTSGTILGTLTEQTGAVLPNTSVTLTNTGTADTRVTNTNDAGVYQFVNVPPGSYELTVSKQGFKTLHQGPITLQVEGSLEINLTMALGSQTQTVTVNAQTPLVEAETTSLGAVVDQRETDEIPLNGRNPMNLTALVPSVIPQGQSLGTPTGTNPFAWGNYQIGGGMANQSATYLDGAPVNTLYDNITALVPTQDSLQEFKVDTNNLSAEYGHLAGGAINFRTKSGTNELHGSLWEFLRNKVLNANDFFSNQAGLARPAFTQNQYGFNVGGPFYIPHVYDGRNKTFFFVDWEGFGLRQGETFTETVPTAAERAGDLSALQTPIYDPLTTCGVAGFPACAPGTPLYNRKEFPNETIPQSRLNPVALAYLNRFFPLPNTPGGLDGVNNFTANASTGGNNYETVVHIDQNVSEKQHISARYTNWMNDNLPINPLGTGICQDRCGETFTTNNFVFGDTYSFSPTTILDMRISYERFYYLRSALLTNFSLTSLGLPAGLASQVEFPGPPVMSVSGFDTAGTFSSQGADSTIHNATDTDRIAGNLTKFIGNHTLKFGGEFQRGTFNYVQTNVSAGIFYFNNGFTAQNPLTGVDGLGLASYLLGYPDSGSADVAAPVAAEQLYPGLFVNDDWRVAQKLTLHMGLRWEDDLPWTERHNRISFFDPTIQNPLVQSVGNYPGAVELVASSVRGSRYNDNNNLKQFSPRVGLDYAVGQNTVFSMGYGIFWLPTDVGFATSPNNDAINSFGTPYTASVNNGLTPVNSLTNPFPQGGIISPPERNPSYQKILLGTGITENFVNNPYPYAEQWNVGVQQQIGSNLVLDIAYGGAKGTHLPYYALNQNQLPDQDLALGDALLKPAANPFYGIINPAYGLGAPTVPAGQLLLKYQQYNGVSIASAAQGESSYNSMQVKLQRRFSGGASVNAAYTWSKLMSDTDTLTAWLEPATAGAYGGVQDNNNLKAENSLSSNDATNRLVLSYVYDLPVGRGRANLSNISRGLDYVIGGWGVEGITTLMSGFPLGFSTNENLTNSFGGGSRPNVVPGCAKQINGAATSRLNEWFNTSCFTQPAAFTFGNESRNDGQLRAPGVADWDTSAFKNFSLDAEGKRVVQFRVESFNVFNRVQFGYPGTTLEVSTFGVVNQQYNLPRIVQFALRINY